MEQAVPFQVGGCLGIHRVRPSFLLPLLRGADQHLCGEIHLRHARQRNDILRGVFTPVYIRAAECADERVHHHHGARALQTVHQPL